MRDTRYYYVIVTIELKQTSYIGNNRWNFKFKGEERIVDNCRVRFCAQNIEDGIKSIDINQIKYIELIDTKDSDITTLE